MNYKDLEGRVEAQIQAEQGVKDRLESARANITSELRQRFAFPSPVKGAVEESANEITVVAHFQRRAEEEKKQGVHSLRCEVQLVVESGSVVAYIDRGAGSFSNLESAEGRGALYAAVDGSLEAKVADEKWLEPPPPAATVRAKAS